MTIISKQSIINDFRSGMSIKELSRKYKMTEKQLDDAIAKEFGIEISQRDSEYKKKLAEHKNNVNEKYNIAYEKLKSGNYWEALKLGLSATIAMLNPPQNPNLITGAAPAPATWRDVKSLFGLIKSLKNLPNIIADLKNCKSLSQFKNFMTKLVQKLKSTKAKPAKTPSGGSAVKQNPKTQADFINECSKGKNLIDMTDEELIRYYKKLIPDISRDELKCLIDQVHRIKKGGQRWLNTEKENDLLRSIYEKFVKNRKKNGIGMKEYSEAGNKAAEIPFKKRELTDFQRNQLSGWYNKGETKCLEPIFDELGTVLDHDVYLYRCVTVRAEMPKGIQQQQCDFLNTIKEGSVINNGESFTSTSKNINNTLNYGLTFGQSYVLKIKVPKGTKVLDMRHHNSKMDEIVLPPCSYKVNKVDYTTGVVDCDFIPH